MRVAMSNIRDEHTAGPIEILVAIDISDHAALGVIPNDWCLEADGIRFKLMPAVEQELAFGTR